MRVNGLRRAGRCSVLIGALAMPLCPGAATAQGIDPGGGWDRSGTTPPLLSPAPGPDAQRRGTDPAGQDEGRTKRQHWWQENRQYPWQENRQHWWDQPRDGGRRIVPGPE